MYSHDMLSVILESVEYDIGKFLNVHVLQAPEENGHLGLILSVEMNGIELNWSPVEDYEPDNLTSITCAWDSSATEWKSWCVIKDSESSFRPYAEAIYTDGADISSSGTVAEMVKFTRQIFAEWAIQDAAAKLAPEEPGQR